MYVQKINSYSRIIISQYKKKKIAIVAVLFLCSLLSCKVTVALGSEGCCHYIIISTIISESHSHAKVMCLRGNTKL